MLWGRVRSEGGIKKETVDKKRADGSGYIEQQQRESVKNAIEEFRMLNKKYTFMKMNHLYIL